MVNTVMIILSCIAPLQNKVFPLSLVAIRSFLRGEHCVRIHTLEWAELGEIPRKGTRNIFRN